MNGIEYEGINLQCTTGGEMLNIEPSCEEGESGAYFRTKMEGETGSRGVWLSRADTKKAIRSLQKILQMQEDRADALMDAPPIPQPVGVERRGGEMVFFGDAIDFPEPPMPVAPPVFEPAPVGAAQPPPLVQGENLTAEEVLARGWRELDVPFNPAAVRPAGVVW